jgi:archaellum component FlaC
LWLNTIYEYVSYHLGEATLSRSYSSIRLTNDALGKKIKECKRVMEMVHKSGRSGTGDKSDAAQAREASAS